MSFRYCEKCLCVQDFRVNTALPFSGCKCEPRTNPVLLEGKLKCKWKFSGYKQAGRCVHITRSYIGKILFHDVHNSANLTLQRMVASAF